VRSAKENSSGIIVKKIGYGKELRVFKHLYVRTSTKKDEKDIAGVGILR
jgi:hypothetical protein